jgi:hypothetical protein
MCNIYVTDLTQICDISVTHLHNAVLAASHEQLAVLPEAAAVGNILEARKGAAHLTCQAVIHNHLWQHMHDFSMIVRGYAPLA